MRVGATYIGLVYHTRLQLLTNVVDRNSLKYRTESGSFSYQTDLATQQLFEELVAPDEDENELEDDEEDEEHS